MRLTHGGQSHLWFPNTAILPRCSCAHPVAQWPSSGKSDQCSSEDGKIHEANTLTVEIIRRRSEVLTLRQVDREERAAGPGHNKGRELDNRESKELPRNPEVEKYGFEGMRIGLIELPLLLARRAFAKVRIALGCCLLAEIGHCASCRYAGYFAA